MGSRHSMAMHSLRILILSGLFSTALCACGSSESPLINDLNESLGVLQSRLNEGRKEVETTTSAELEKLHKLEYKVIDLAGSDSTEELEKQLAELGKERWDCFYVQPIPDKLRFFCKRNPKTFLKYIPRVF